MPSDFTNITDIAGSFSEYEADETVDFEAIGDYDNVIISGSGWGDDWGGSPWGGEDTVVIISSPITDWTDITEP